MYFSSENIALVSACGSRRTFGSTLPVEFGDSLSYFQEAFLFRYGCVFFFFLLEGLLKKQYLHVLGDLQRVGEQSTDGLLARNSVYSRRFVTVILIEDKVVHEPSPRHVFGTVYSPLESSLL